MDRQKRLRDDEWDAWHPVELGRRLHGISRPWCIVGGWALDLWHGKQTRAHDDLEFTVLREGVPTFMRALPGMRFHAVGSGVVTPLKSEEQPPADIFQIWCEDVEAGCYRVDMMVEPGTPDLWAYKRDTSIVRSRVEMIGRTSAGLPYLKPAGVLLFKAKHVRSKDQFDFDEALPKLEAKERAWLAACLARAHPGHAWIDLL